jgi:hypothetical protein
MWFGPNSEVVSAKEVNEEIHRRLQNGLDAVAGTADSWKIAAVEVPLSQVEPSYQVRGVVAVYIQLALVERHSEQRTER